MWSGPQLRAACCFQLLLLALLLPVTSPFQAVAATDR
jgi:hypothetical protein